MTIEDKITSVEGSIRDLRDSIFQRLGNIRTTQSTIFTYAVMMTMFHGCVIDAKYKGLRERLNKIITVQEQSMQIHTEADREYYFIDGKKAYLTIEGKPIEEYMQEKQNE